MDDDQVKALSFTEYTKIREDILAWISRDTGLCEFLVPDALAASWSPEHKQKWTNAILDNFLKAKASDIGSNALRRVLSRETAGNLRRGCVRLRNNTATNRDIAKMGVLLECLWNDTSSNLDDNTWARCSLRFDTALISLRVSYMWLYDESENKGADIDTRKQIFLSLVDSFFNGDAPTDDKDDKHSSNFHDLLAVWKKEFSSYVEGDSFNEKIKRLKDTQPLQKVASSIDKFLSVVAIDDSWVLRMRNAHTALQKDKLARKGQKRKRSSKTSRQVDRVSNAQTDIIFPENDSSSFEPVDHDSDFNANVAGVDSNDDEFTDSGDMVDDLAKGIMSQQARDGSVVRRSIRVAQALHGGSPLHRRRSRVRRSPVRFAELLQESSSDEQRASTRPSPSRTLATKNDIPSGHPTSHGQSSTFEGNDTQRPVKATKRKAGGPRKVSKARRLGNGMATRSRTTGRSSRKLSLIESDEEDADHDVDISFIPNVGPVEGYQMNESPDDGKVRSSGDKDDPGKESRQSRRKRLMAALVA